MGPQIQVLGPVKIALSGESTTTTASGRESVPGPSQRRLLAILCANAGNVVRAEQLVEDLGVSSVGGVRTAISRLRQSIGDVLRSQPPGYVIEEEAVDAHQFVQLLKEARSLAGAEAVLRYDQAIALWNGPAFMEFVDEPWAVAEATRLDELHATAREERIDALIAAGDVEDATADVERLIRQYPVRERPRAQLMLALAQQGRATEAARSFQSYRSYLAEEVGVDPSGDLAELERQILAGDISAATRTVDRAPTNEATPKTTRSADNEHGRRRRTMAFLFTDIEGSTLRWEQYPDAMMESVASHDAAITAAVKEHGGSVFHHSGDGIIASFPDPTEAIAAGALLQTRLATLDWTAIGGLRVRTAIHVGRVVVKDGEPFGWALNFGSRLLGACHGGQVLVSESTVEMLDAQVGEGFELISLGTMRLRDIAQLTQIFQLCGPDLDADFPPLRTKAGAPRLPAPATSTIGRDSDIARLTADISAHRLVTVAGPTGIGTSRVALVAARACGAAFADGAVHTDLAGVDPAHIAGAIATSLKVGARPGQPIEQSVFEWLANQELLLVLNHCGEAADTIAGLVAVVLRKAPGVTVVCTSDRSMGVEGERVHRLHPLEIDDAVELFRERAAGVGTVVADGDALRSLCERLDRIPLSIEVAAANTAIYTVQELRNLLEKQHGDGSNASVLQDSMSDTVAVAIGSLSSDLQSMLGAAAVFAGPFDRRDFAKVCASPGVGVDPDAALAELVDRSLVQADTGGGTRSFRVLESIASVARPNLSVKDQEQAEERFLIWVTEIVAAAAEGLRGPDEETWSDMIALLFPNVRAGFERAFAAGDLARASSICTELWDYAFMRFNAEYFQWSVRVLERFPAGDMALLGPVFGTAAFGAWLRDELDLVVEWADQAIAVERELGLDFDLTARLALVSAMTYSNSGPLRPEILPELTRHQQSRPELYFQVNVEVQNSIMSTWLGRPELAIKYGVQSVKLARESDNPSSLAFALWALGAALESDDPDQAETLLGNALETARDVGNDWITSLVQMWLAQMLRRTRTALDAIPLLLDLLDLLLRAGHQSHLWTTLRTCGLVLGDLGHDQLAVQLGAWVRDAHLAMPALPIDARQADAQLDLITQNQGEVWVQRAELLTQTWTVDSAVATVRAELEACLTAAATSH